VSLPTAEVFKDYGLCKDYQQNDFLHGFKLFIKFLKSCDYDLTNRTLFDVNHQLYKGFLLVKFQIETTATKREKVYEVENSFRHWMKQIETVIIQGQQIRRDPPDVGPLNELEYWRSMLTHYTSIVEFVLSKPFNNHLQCLILSHSKLVKKWKQLDNQLTIAICEARDNVRYMCQMERFWDPLYRFYTILTFIICNYIYIIISFKM